MDPIHPDEFLYNTILSFYNHSDERTPYITLIILMDLLRDCQTHEMKDVIGKAIVVVLALYFPTHTDDWSSATADRARIREAFAT